VNDDSQVEQCRGGLALVVACERKGLRTSGANATLWRGVGISI
jgi:hypothetical protein